MVSSDAEDDPVDDVPIEDELVDEFVEFVEFVDEFMVDWACAPSASAPAPSRPSAVTLSEAPRSKNLNFFITFLHCAVPHQTACPADYFFESTPVLRQHLVLRQHRIFRMSVDPDAEARTA
jgi:hypothetical protein